MASIFLAVSRRLSPLETLEPVEGQIVKGQAITFAVPAEPVDGSTDPTWVFAESREPVEAED